MYPALSKFYDFVAILGFSLVLITALISGVFLYWRAGRHEYIESDFLFDLLIVGFSGAFIFSRIFDFIFGWQAYGWSWKKLIFINAYGGFDAWGAIFGASLVVFLYLRRKKTNFFTVADLAAAPVVFATSIVGLGNLIYDLVYNFANFLSYYDFVSYFAVFIILKRLEVRKRHLGFFVCLSVVLISIINLFGIYFENHWGNSLFSISGSDLHLLKPLFFLVFGLVSWYMISKRKLRRDFKSISASILLFIFKVRRVLTILSEADRLSKFIILFPYFAAKMLVNSVRLLIREIIFMMVEFMEVLRTKK